MKLGVLVSAAVVSAFGLVAPSCANSSQNQPGDSGTPDVHVGPCGPGNNVLCNNACVDTQGDYKNCGACGKQCGDGLVCSQGTCAAVCGGSTTHCSNNCVDTGSDVNNCGGCGKGCPSGNVCSKGSCALTCQAGLTNCNSDCVDITQDDGNCGMCGSACPSGQVCVGSSCQATCQSGWTSCPNGADSGTTCVDTQNDPSHCGGCSTTCPSGYFCSPKAGIGTCGLECFGGTSLCSNACVDENIDPNNCGSCNAKCSGSCSGGHCCSSGQIYCGGCDTVPNCIKKTGGRISAGYGSVCAITPSGTVECWGYGFDGELGNGGTSDSNTPVAVTGLTSVTNVGLGAFHSCAVSGSTAYCWGDDFSGQVGVGTNSDTYLTPQQVTGIANVLKIDGGDDQTCALLSNQSIHCWGGNTFGDVGDGTATEDDSPVALTGITTAIDINAGLGYHSCALLSSGAAQCWGEDDNGECGDGTFNPEDDSPANVSSLSSGLALSLGYYHSCALIGGGNLQCWGYDADGELGDGMTTNSGVPVTASVSGVVAVAAGGAHTCVLTSAGAVECWGDNTDGELGNGTNTSSLTPVTAISSGAVAIAAGGDAFGESFTCAYMGDGTVQCWGSNDFGQLGNGTNTASNVPVMVTGF